MKDSSARDPITVTVQEAERISGIGHTKFYELIKENKVKTVCVGRRRLVNVESLRELLEA